MTAPEFVRMMHWAHVNYGEEKLTKILQAPSREHFHFADNAFCRFQGETGLCTSYQGRAMACRLHGHEAMRAFASSGTEFCDRGPAGNHALTAEQVDPLVENIRQAIALTGITYAPPYFLLSLNLECWLDFVYHPEWSVHRPTLHSTLQFLQAHIILPVLNPIPTHTTLAGKLNTIDRLFRAIEASEHELAYSLLQELQHDYPSCASYYVEEALAMEPMFQVTPNPVSHQ